MPKTPKVHSLTNFSAIMRAVEKFQDARDVAWYRGCGSPSYTLAPTLFRHPAVTDINDLHKLEQELSVTFNQRSPPFVTQDFRTDWDRIFFMQHYGIPTRLLDWTESPFIALYFALTTCKRGPDNAPIAPAVLWMLDPANWNHGALDDTTFDGGVLDQDRGQVKSYSPGVDLELRKEMPITIYGTHNSPRIVAQRGMFALFGKDTRPMEVLYGNQKFKAGILQKIEIPAENIDSVATSLFRKGVSDSTVYPDLTGLSMELRRRFGF